MLKKNKVKRTVKILLVVILVCVAVCVAIFIKKISDGKSVENTEMKLTENGIVIPNTDIPMSENETVDMIAFFIYQGRRYVQCETLSDNGEIVGEYLGSSNGRIDESTQKNGDVDFVGNVKGDIYSVKGYDVEDMLCMYDYGGVNITTYVVNDGITLKYGSDIFDGIFKVSENCADVDYETSASRTSQSGNIYRFKDTSDKVLTKFIDEVKNAELMIIDDVFENNDKTDIYDTEQYHIYFRLNNGMTVHLIVCNEGYVYFNNFYNICLKVSDECFENLIYNLNRNTGAELMEK